MRKLNLVHAKSERPKYYRNRGKDTGKSLSRKREDLTAKLKCDMSADTPAPVKF